MLVRSRQGIKNWRESLKPWAVRYNSFVQLAVTIVNLTRFFEHEFRRSFWLAD